MPAAQMLATRAPENPLKKLSGRLQALYRAAPRSSRRACGHPPVEIVGDTR